MVIVPEGHIRLELSRFINPPAIADHSAAPVNAAGYLYQTPSTDLFMADLLILKKCLSDSVPTLDQTFKCKHLPII